MKKLLLMASMVATTFAFAQSNEAGTIQLGLGWGATLGGATIETTQKGAYAHDGSDTTMTTTDDGVGINSNYGIRAQYGVSELISVGIYVRMERGFYTVTNTTAGISFSSTMLASGFGFGLEPKIYPVNNDKFNLYVAPSIGFSTATTTMTFFTAYTGKASGLNYGLTVGFNWYFSDVVGLSADLGYAGSALSGTMDDTTIFKDFTYDINSSGFYTGLGLTLKFGN